MADASVSTETVDEPPIDTTTASIKQEDDIQNNEALAQDENENECEDEESEECEWCTVCISNLSDSLKEDHLRDLFKTCGQIEIVCIKLKFGQGRVCYIKFADSDSAETALLLNEQILDGKALQISLINDSILANYKQTNDTLQTNTDNKTSLRSDSGNENDEPSNQQQTALQTVQSMATPKNVCIHTNKFTQFRNQSTNTQSNGNADADNADLNGTFDGIIGGMATTTMNSAENEERQEKLARTIYVGNLNPMIQSDHLTEFFGVCGKVNLVKIAGNSTNSQAARYGFVEFEKLEFARSAYNLSGHFLLDRPIKIGPAKNAILNPHPKSANILTNPVKINHAMAKVRLLQQRISNRYGSEEREENEQKIRKKKKRSRSRSHSHSRSKRDKKRRKKSKKKDDDNESESANVDKSISKRNQRKKSMKKSKRSHRNRSRSRSRSPRYHRSSRYRYRSRSKSPIYDRYSRRRYDDDESRSRSRSRSRSHSRSRKKDKNKSSKRKRKKMSKKDADKKEKSDKNKKKKKKGNLDGMSQEKASSHIQIKDGADNVLIEAVSEKQDGFEMRKNGMIWDGFQWHQAPNSTISLVTLPRTTIKGGNLATLNMSQPNAIQQAATLAACGTKMNTKYPPNPMNACPLVQPDIAAACAAAAAAAGKLTPQQATILKLATVGSGTSQWPTKSPIAPKTETKLTTQMLSSNAVQQQMNKFFPSFMNNNKDA